MPEYRAYTIDADGHIQRRFDLIATDESEAMEQAKRLMDSHDIELWQGARKLVRFYHKDLR